MDDSFQSVQTVTDHTTPYHNPPNTCTHDRSMISLNSPLDSDNHDRNPESIARSDSGTLESQPVPPSQARPSDLIVHQSSVSASTANTDVQTIAECDFSSGTQKRSLRTIRRPTHLDDYVLEAAATKEANISEKTATPISKNIKEPRTVREAVLDPSWVAAMEEEMGALIQNQTWDLVQISPR
ncbi:hypothetical protein ZOSMA_9G01560 [Zostera marina]|uniref:Gag-Pol polyprotein n=1 Tax=Zostera marina TaxID=29655 RepID=A0A0K9NIZ0_ZOSMR|nr:hypothetical protein ZOSMA_9G01560 [Zostera marina]